MKKLLFGAATLVALAVPVGSTLAVSADPIPPEPGCFLSLDPTLTYPPYISFQCTPYDYMGLHFNAISIP